MGTPSDLHGLRHLVRLYDRVELGDFARATELRLSMDGFGVSPKDQQHLRWRAPAPTPEPTTTPSQRYGHLRAAPSLSEGGSPPPPRGRKGAKESLPGPQGDAR